MMFSLIAWSLTLPVALGMLIESNVLTTTSLVCATRYAELSLKGSLPTTTVHEVYSHGPVVFHTTVTPVITITPTPKRTKSTHLVADTVWVTAVPTDGVWNSTSTVLETSTYWHHVYITNTETVNVTGTSKTTSWIPASTGFRPIKDTKRGWDAAQPGHPHRIRDASISTRANKPLASRYPAAVTCTEQVGYSTTERVIWTQEWPSTTTLPVQTTYRNTTIHATITSTVLDPQVMATAILERRKGRDWLKYFQNHDWEADLTRIVEAGASSSDLPSSSISSDLTTSSTSSGLPNPPSSEISSSTASPSPTLAVGIITNTFTRTRTPFTVTQTWTGTETVTQTNHIHATQTITGFAACATENVLYVDRRQKRLNGIASGIRGQQIEHVIPHVESAYDCCVACVAGDLACAYSLYEIEGPSRGRCLLYARSQSKVPNQEVLGSVVVREEGDSGIGAAQCTNQHDDMGVFSFRHRNGEGAWVASNGYCGYLSDSDIVFP